MRSLIIATLASLAIARVASAQSVDAFAPQPNGPPASLAIQADGKVVITGNFNQIGTDTRHGVARLAADGANVSDTRSRSGDRQKLPGRRHRRDCHWAGMSGHHCIEERRGNREAPRRGAPERCLYDLNRQLRA